MAVAVAALHGISTRGNPRRCCDSSGTYPRGGRGRAATSPSLLSTEYPRVATRGRAAIHQKHIRAAALPASFRRFVSPPSVVLSLPKDPEGSPRGRRACARTRGPSRCPSSCCRPSTPRGPAASARCPPTGIMSPCSSRRSTSPCRRARATASASTCAERPHLEETTSIIFAALECCLEGQSKRSMSARAADLRFFQGFFARSFRPSPSAAQRPCAPAAFFVMACDSRASPPRRRDATSGEALDGKTSEAAREPTSCRGDAAIFYGRIAATPRPRRG